MSLSGVSGVHGSENDPRIVSEVFAESWIFPNRAHIQNCRSKFIRVEVFWIVKSHHHYRAFVHELRASSRLRLILYACPEHFKIDQCLLHVPLIVEHVHIFFVPYQSNREPLGLVIYEIIQNPCSHTPTHSYRRVRCVKFDRQLPPSHQT